MTQLGQPEQNELVDVDTVEEDGLSQKEEKNNLLKSAKKCAAQTLRDCQTQISSPFADPSQALKAPRAIDLACKNNNDNWSGFVQPSKENAYRLRESLLLYEKDHRSLVAAHIWLVSELEEYMLSAYLTLLWFTKFIVNLMKCPPRALRSRNLREEHTELKEFKTKTWKETHIVEKLQDIKNGEYRLKL
uniref:KANSL3 helical domain-containing protein n=1 Tax=Ditylenchus dipsaci TaxID=166011 RepID=A0A915DI95_9BILA